MRSLLWWGLSWLGLFSQVLSSRLFSCLSSQLFWWCLSFPHHAFERVLLALQLVSQVNPAHHSLSLARTRNISCQELLSPASPKGPLASLLQGRDHLLIFFNALWNFWILGYWLIILNRKMMQFF